MPVLEMKRPVALGRGLARRVVEREDDFDDCPLCAVYGREPNAEIQQRMADVDAGRDLVGPFATVEECWASMMAGMEALGVCHSGNRDRYTCGFALMTQRTRR